MLIFFTFPDPSRNLKKKEKKGTKKKKKEKRKKRERDRDNSKSDRFNSSRLMTKTRRKKGRNYSRKKLIKKFPWENRLKFEAWAMLNHEELNSFETKTTGRLLKAREIISPSSQYNVLYRRYNKQRESSPISALFFFPSHSFFSLLPRTLLFTAFSFHYQLHEKGGFDNM